jgi:hypothetical protein
MNPELASHRSSLIKLDLSLGNNSNTRPTRTKQERLKYGIMQTIFDPISY